MLLSVLQAAPATSLLYVSLAAQTGYHVTVLESDERFTFMEPIEDNLLFDIKKQGRLIEFAFS